MKLLTKIITGIVIANLLLSIYYNFVVSPEIGFPYPEDHYPTERQKYLEAGSLGISITMAAQLVCFIGLGLSVYYRKRIWYVFGLLIIVNIISFFTYMAGGCYMAGI